MPRRTATAAATAVAVAGALVGPGAVRSAGDAGGAPDVPVIVVLADQHPDLPDRDATRGRRRAAVRAEQAPLMAQAMRSGARNVRGFSLINAFAATVSTAEAARLSAAPGVAAVVPDRPLRIGHPPAPPAGPGGPIAPPTGPGAPGAVPVGAPAPTAAAARFPDLAAAAKAGVCPADPAQPLVEPEALSLIHAPDAVTPAPPGLDGQGVKVGFIADRIDTRNPDLVRTDGTPVITDVQDYTSIAASAGSTGAEAFGDASMIAAQGNRTYDLADFVSPAHPLPRGCTIRIRGVAPAASLTALEVFGTYSAPSSAFVEAIDYAVNTAHVDVLNESFGGNPLPNLSTDPIALADEQAVAAGVTVVASSGDSGSGGSLGSPGSDPAVITVGATTSLRGYAQTSAGAYTAAGSTGWSNDNISAISSDGVLPTGRTLDLVAPGDSGWALCSPDAAHYSDCTSDRAPASTTTGTPVQLFGGTSQSAPLTAGAAALVIQAYRQTHGGSSPQPALVKQILTSTATDLGLPGSEQGAGLLDVAAATRMAASVHDAFGAPAAQGDSLQNSGALTATAAPGTPVNLPLTVTNTSGRPQTVRAGGRVLGEPRVVAAGTVELDGTDPATAHYDDRVGRRRAYTTFTFTVPSGQDVLTALFAFDDPQHALAMSLIDPKGLFQGDSLPQDASNHARLEVRHPAAGRWTAFVSTAGTAEGAFDGPVRYEIDTARNTSFGTVTPASLVLAPGATGTFDLHATTPADPTDLSGAVTLTTATGLHSAAPLTLRSLIVPAPGGTTFGADLTGGNGRGAPGMTTSWSIAVPPGHRDLAVGLTVDGRPAPDLYGLLVAPDGETVAATSTKVTAADGTTLHTSALDLYRRDPAPGTWTLVVATDKLAGGGQPRQHLTGRAALDTVRVTTTGLPTPGTTLPAGTPVTALVTVTNTGIAPETFFVDPRRDGTEEIVLSPVEGNADGMTVPLPTDVRAPAWLVPPHTTALAVDATADRPVELDLEAGADLPQGGTPEVVGRPVGTAVTLRVTAAGLTPAGTELTPGPWSVIPWISGATNGEAVTATADIRARATTRPFDPTVASSTGDFWAPAAPGAPAPTGIRLSPGMSAAIVVTITPAGRPGTTVSGTLFVDDFSRTLKQGDELAGVRYGYTIG